MLYLVSDPNVNIWFQLFLHYYIVVGLEQLNMLKNRVSEAASFCLQVLMLIDASFGFEMETFEFLNICQVHGFPRIMGVLTHLDSFKNNKSLRKTKKTLKHRFWTEVYQVGTPSDVSGWTASLSR